MKRHAIILILTAFLCLGLTFWSHSQARMAPAAQAVACATASFGTATTYATESGSRYTISVALGDFNGDGKPDMVTGGFTTSNVSVLLNNGTGGFGTATQFGMGFVPNAVAAADVNGDGKLDIISADAADNGGRVSVRLGNGTGGFGNRNAFVLPGPGFNTVEPHDLVVSDLNGDGKLDLATANFESDNAIVLLNNCGSPCNTPSFAAPVYYPTGFNPGSIAAGDVNGDGKRDLVVANHNLPSSNISVLLGNGDGTFQAAVNFNPGGQPNAVELGDLNGDGKLDLIVSNRNQQQLAVMLNTCATPPCSAPSFGTVTSFSVGSSPAAITTGDFDGDGDLDVVVGGGALKVFLGNGAGGLGMPLALGPTFQGDVTSGDVNGDGKLDLVTGNEAENASVLLNNCQPNQTPTLSGLGVTRTEGTAGSSAQIATANDTEDAKNTLKIEVSSDGTTFGSSATKNNVSVMLTDSDGTAAGTNPDTTGKVFATVAANCGATLTLFTLRVTDSGSLTNTTTFIVSIIANLAPTLSYNNQMVNYGNTLMVNVGSVNDNGSIASYSLKSVTPTVPAGAVTVNSSNGVVTVSNNVPAGSYAVVVTATDNCNLGTDANFMLTVNCVVDPVVTNLNDSGAGSLRAAIAAACPNSTITFQNGLTGTITLTTGQLVIDKNLIIQGPGAQVVTVSGNHASRVFYVNTGVTATLDRLTIADGQAPVNGGSSRGGGVYNDAGDLTISNSVLSGNMVSGGTFGTGGGIFNFTGVLRIYNCTLTGNTASGLGGGLANEYGMAMISHSTFSSNSITAANNGEGGGIWTRGTLTLTNSTLTGNMISGSGINGGGGLFIFGGHGVITHSTLTGNSVSGGTSNKGGGLENSGQFTGLGYTIQNTTIAGNSAATSGPDVQGALVSLGYNLIGKGEGSSGITHNVNNDKVGTLANPLDPLLGSLANNGGPTQTQRPKVDSPLLNTAGPVSEVQLVRVAGTGTFTLTFNGQTTGALAANASAAAVQAELEGLSSIGAGNVAVSVSTFPNSVYAVRFQGTLAELNQPTFTGTASANTTLTILTALDGGVLATDQRGFTRPQGSAPDIGAVETSYALAATTGTPQSTVVNTSFANALQVTLTESGQPVSDAQITFSGPGSGASVTFPNGNTASTDGQGRASVNVNANGVTGAYTVNATAPGLTVSFNLTNLCATVTVTGVQPVLPTCFGGANGSLTVQASGGSAPLQYSINNGQTFQNSNVFNGLTAGSYQVVVRDANNCPSVAFPVSLSQPTAITVTTVPVNPTCFGGANGSLTINAMGGTGALQYSINNGASFQPSNVFTGLAAGVYPVVVKDMNGCPTLPQNVTLSQPTALSLSPSTLPTGVAGQAFMQQFTPSGGTGTKSVSLQGALPNWLSFTPANATLSGTPPQPATVSFTLVVTDQANCTALFNYTLNIVCPTITLTPTTLPNGVQGAAYSQTLTTTPSGGNYSYAVTTNVLPPGLSLTSNGVLSGIPTAPGNYTFGVTVTGWGANGGGCVRSQSFNLLITGTCSTISLNPTSLPAGALGSPYTQTLSATGGTAPYSYSVSNGALPSGLTLNASTGELSGIPTVSGTFIFTLRATGRGGCSGQRSYTLTITCTGLAFSPTTLPAGAKGVAYSQQLSIGPSASYGFSLLLGNLPPGFTLSQTGQISGITTQTGTYQFTIKAVAGACQGMQAYSLVINGGTNTALALSGDYDGDGKTDPALWSAKEGVWRIVRSSDGQTVQQRWGTAGDVTLLGDYDGDGRSDLAVFRPSDATFYVHRSSDGQFLVKQWGLPTDVPVPGDYDGDGRTDIAVWRGAEGIWYIVRSSDSQIEVQAWGAAAAPYYDVPVAGDYDGDGKSDLAVFRRATGTWFIKRSADGQILTKLWGLGTDVPVAADYDRDGRTDLAVWRPAEGHWYIWHSATNDYRVTRWGMASDQAIAGDYDGDGQADVAVWRSADRSWYVFGSRAQAPQQVLLGQAGDLLVGAKAQ